MSNTKKATATKTVATVNATPVTTASKKVATKKEVAPAPVKTEMVVLGNSTYHFVRHWLKSLFASANIQMKWVKDTEGYNGVIKVNKADLAKAKKVYTDYIKSEGCVEMITF